jgi:glyoxylase-like metal-dependent hydrolase (beta-lactamase superfamily II)
MQIDGYDIDIVVQGFPGKSVCHGGLGWSSVVIIRAPGRIAMVDVGGFGMRPMLNQRYASRKLDPAAVTDVLLTHSHHDHSVNFPLFRNARIVIGADELAWALKEPWGKTPVPEFYVEKLRDWPTLHTVRDGDEAFPGITAHLAPGHTPGCLFYVLKGSERDVIFTGDAAKNRAELVSSTTDMTYDAALSARSIARIWEYWRRRPGTIVVPGHDMPMTQHDGKITYIGKREAAITAWYGDDMETTTLFNLVP